MPDNNFFDELIPNSEFSDIQEESKALEAERVKLDYLIHKVFKQNKDGKELLKIWEKTLMMKPGAEPGIDMIDVGIREGLKRFIRNLILTTQRVEKV